MHRDERADVGVYQNGELVRTIPLRQTSATTWELPEPFTAEHEGVTVIARLAGQDVPLSFGNARPYEISRVELRCD